MIHYTQRHTKANTCPICNGQEAERRGHGSRDWGFDSDDGRFTYCSRVESPDFSPGAQAWRHALNGECRCGQVHGSYVPPAPTRPVKHDATEPEPLDSATLDRFFRRLLELCPLRDEHRERFAARGTADLQAAERYGYGSLPRKGAEVDAVLVDLVGEFGRETVTRAPGFWERRDGNLTMHTATDTYDAAIIPGTDDLGHITCLVRMVMLDGTGTRGKYETFLRTKGAFTVAGTFGRSRQREVRTVEGLHKAYVCSVRDPDVIYLGLSGTALHDRALDTLRRYAPDVVTECLDADKSTNSAVGQAAKTMHQTLAAAGFAVEEGTWDAADGKGPDDLLAGDGRMRFRPISGGGPMNQDGSSGDEDGEEWCSRCAEHGRHVEQKVASLDASLTKVRTELADLRDQQSLTSAAMRNHRMGAERYTGVAVVNLCKIAAERGETKEGFVHVKLGGTRRPDDPEPDLPPENSLAYLSGHSAHQVSRHLDRLQTIGLLEKTIIRRPQQIPDPTTGEIRWVDVPECYVKLAEPPRETLWKIARGASPVRHGGARPKCPNCGSEALITITKCADCGQVVHESTPRTDVASDFSGMNQDGSSAADPEQEGSMNQDGSPIYVTEKKTRERRFDAAAVLRRRAVREIEAEPVREVSHHGTSAHAPPRCTECGGPTARGRTVCTICLSMPIAAVGGD